MLIPSLAFFLVIFSAHVPTHYIVSAYTKKFCFILLFTSHSIFMVLYSHTCILILLNINTVINHNINMMVLAFRICHYSCQTCQKLCIGKFIIL